MKREKEKKEKTLPDPGSDQKPIFSEKKNVLRLVGFLIAFFIAVGSITFGVVQCGRKSPGWQEVAARPDGDLPFFASGIHLNFYFEGSSNRIKSAMNTLANDYTALLKQSYRWFDSVNTYPGVPNLASVNLQRGTAVMLDEPLFRALQDAAERTARGEGYSLFAGPLIQIRDQLLYANEPGPLDPLNNEELAEQIRELDRVIRENPGELVLDAEQRTATLLLSDEYAALLEAYGMTDSPVIDLGVLADAYRVDHAAKELEARGYGKGYLSTDTGMTRPLSGWEAANSEYCLYSMAQNGTREVSATKAAVAGTAACCFRAFALSEEEYGFYTLQTAGKTVWRNPFQNAFPTEQPLLSVLVVTGDRDVVGAAYLCACLMAQTGTDAAVSLAKRATAAWILDLNDEKAELSLSDLTGVQTLAGYETVLP